MDMLVSDHTGTWASRVPTVTSRAGRAGGMPGGRRGVGYDREGTGEVVRQAGKADQRAWALGLPLGSIGPMRLRALGLLRRDPELSGRAGCHQPSD
jgi:hypothetical protein